MTVDEPGQEHASPAALSPPLLATYTDDQLLAGISNALDAGDLEAAAAITRRLALQAPDKAQAILDAVNGKVTLTFDLSEQTS